jgi:hypothetical protein
MHSLLKAVVGVITNNIIKVAAVGVISNGFLTAVVCVSLTTISCIKSNPEPSENVLITVTNQCSCTIEIFQDNNYKMGSDYNCSMAKNWQIKLSKGKYQIKVTSQQQPLKWVEFQKGLYSQNLTIEF